MVRRKARRREGEDKRRGEGEKKRKKEGEKGERMNARMDSKENKRVTGAHYEQEVAEYLKTQGYEILEMNYRCRIGEIDIIAKDGEYLVFVEVKYRKKSDCGTPQDAVNWKKQRKISKTAVYYLMKECGSLEVDCRFDVAAVLDGEIELIKNAFSYVGQ